MSVPSSGDEDRPVTAGLTCPYCDTSTATTLPTKRQTGGAGVSLTLRHECPGPWNWEVEWNDRNGGRVR